MILKSTHISTGVNTGRCKRGGGSLVLTVQRYIFVMRNRITDHSFNSTILTEFLQLLQEVQSSIFYQNYPPKSPAQTPLRKMMCDFLLDQIYFYLEQAK